MAQIAHKILLFNTAGVQQAEILNYLSLSYTRRVNAPGVISFRLPDNHSILSSIADKWIAEVWRRGIDDEWRLELSALLRDERWAIGSDGIGFYEGVGIGMETMLSWRIVNWYAGTNLRSQFTSVPGETIMKTLVDYNAGSNATTVNGRRRDGTISGLSVQADSAAGTSINFFCHGENLLESLQDLAKIVGGDFSLEHTGSGNTFFKWHGTRFGTDKTGAVQFAISLGNMANPEYSVRRSDERTVAAVWGQGEADERNYVTRTGPNYSAGNDIEVFIDAKDIELGNTAGLQARGDKKLDELQAREQFTFDVLQTGSSQYREDYDLGDLVTVINPFNENEMDLKITSVEVRIQDSGAEEVRINMETE